MAYCVLGDLIAQSSEKALITFSDDEETGEIALEVVDQAIRSAEDEVDAYCQARYPLPFNPVPGVIKKMTVDIALYNLGSRRGFSEDSEDAILAKRYTAAIRFLENLSKGLVSIGPQQVDVPKPQTVSIQGSQRIFNRSKLEGF